MNKKMFLYILLSIFLLIVSSPLAVEAHTPGQPPFFKMDGVYTSLYPVPSVSYDGLSVPQDIAPKNYVAGQKINFEIDWKVFGISEEAIKLTSFRWENGDNTRATGLTQTYAYKTPGTYVQTISALPKNVETPQLLQSTLIQVLPNATYVPPTPRISANGSTVNNPAQDIVYLDLTKPIQFEITNNGTSPISKVQWDFGDGKTAEGLKLSHQYPTSAVIGGLSMVQAVARVTDSKGFYNDAFIMIYDKSLIASPSPKPQPKSTISSINLFKPATLLRLGLLTVVAVCIIGIYLKILSK